MHHPPFTENKNPHDKVTGTAREGLISTWLTVLTYQTLVNDAEHEHVMQKDVSWVCRTEADVGDRRVPLQPKIMHSLFLQLPTPLGVFFLYQRVLEDL